MYFARLSLVTLLQEIQRLCGTVHTYSEHMAADGWGAAIAVRSPNARRFDLSGALIRAVDKLCDPHEEHQKLLKESATAKDEHKRRRAKSLMRDRGDRARVMYGYGWAMLNAASQEITGADVYAPKGFQTAMDVLERTKLRLYTSLGISTRSRPLGQWQQGEPFHIAEVKLLEELAEAGEDGCVPETGPELLACYDLYKRGMIEEIHNAPWTYRLRVLYKAVPSASRESQEGEESA